MCLIATSVLFHHPSGVLEKAVLPLDVAPPANRGTTSRTSVLFRRLLIPGAHKKYPDAKVISLGIDDMTQPIASIVTSALAKVSWIIDGDMDDSCDPEVETVASSHLPSQINIL